MNTRLKKHDWKHAARITFFVLGILAALYFFWSTAHLVMAFQEQKHAHIFPTQDLSVGWGQPDNALTQDLSYLAPAGAFTTQNSAFIQLAATTTVSGSENNIGGSSAPTSTPATSPILVPASTVAATSSTDTSAELSTQPATPNISLPLPVIESPQSDTATSSDAITTSSATDTSSNDASSSDPSVSALRRAALQIANASTSDWSIPASASSTTDTIIDLPTPTDVPSSDSSDAGTTTSMISHVAPIIATRARDIGVFVLSQIFATAYATSTLPGSTTTLPLSSTTSTPEVVSESTDTNTADTADVANCTVLGTTCHTVEFSGFTVDGSLTEKPFKGVELNLSLAALATDGSKSGKLSVRYYHAGSWHSAGEIPVDAAISNASNGGYFSEPLKDLNSWSDLSDVKVVIEYNIGDGSKPVSLYLDAVWLDAIYTDQIQNVLSGKVKNPTDVPSNVSFELASGERPQNSLVLDDGTKISFPYLDSLKDSLMVRANKSSYTASGTSTIIYTSITNTGKTTDNFQLFASFPGGDGTVADISQYLQNVPSATTTSQLGDVTYFCEAGWSGATSSTQYSCAATGETYVCSSLNDTGTNCLVSGVTLSTATSTNYINAWVSMDLTPPSSDSKVATNLPPGYKAAAATQKSFEILPGQTLYFKATLKTSDTQAMRFVISAHGQNYFGDIDSMRLQTDAYLTAEGQTKRAALKDNINDQLTEQSDFGVDQLPSFQFKFKTQHNFFERVANWLLRKPDKYVVQSALLHHESGENEHLPVDIEYGANNAWTLQLERKARDFRPGKYSVDLTMNEGGSTYTDSVPFYWGVLALNPDKSSYEPNTNAHLTITALDDSGDTMCNAQLSLTVTDPSGVSSDIPVVSGGGCGENNVTTLPDFIADYQVGGEGTYTLTLSRLDDTGAIITSISDTLTVKAGAPYVVERQGPTRIYPSSAYAMQLAVSAPAGFTGKVVETVPEGFTIADAGGATLSHGDGVIYLTWDASLSGTDVKTFSYTFKAPEVSPYMYLVGPASLSDDNAVVYTEPRTWKIASDAVLISTGVAWMAGNQTTNGTNLNNTTPFALTWNVSSDYDTTYYSYSTSTNPSQLTVKVAGDYLVALTVPVVSTNVGAGTRTKIEADVRVNGGKVNVGVGRGFIRTSGGVVGTSAHDYVLLHNLNAGDVIESYVHQLTTAVDVINIDTQASMYVEYIGNDQSVYFGQATTTTSLTNPGNLNPAATSTLTWYDDPTYGRIDSNYSHSNLTAPDTVTLASQSNYMVFINIPVDATTTNVSPKARVIVNGQIVTGGEFKQGYISNVSGDTDSSLQWSGVIIATTTNERLSVSVLAGAAAGTSTVLNDQASIYIQKLPTSGIYIASATTTTNGSSWNSVAPANVLWTKDLVRDTAAYGHSTSTNSYNITVASPGDYLLAINDSHTGAISNSNETTQVLVASSTTLVPGAEIRSHFIANASGQTQSSGSMVYLLRNLGASSTVSVNTFSQGTTGTVTEDQSALILLWHKSAQSNWIENTEWWYQNVNAQTPTTPWAGVSQGDAITTGNAVESGDAIRLRMGLTAQVNTVAGADSFKLQYAPGSICSLALAWTDVGATGSGSIWRAHANNLVTPGSTLTTLLLTTSSTTETYEESNPSAVTANAASSTQDAEWDWSLENNGAPTGTNYCFRMVQSSGQVLKDYLDYPQLVTNATPIVPTLVTPFDNQKTVSSSPPMDFSSSDDNNDDINYEIQVSTDPAFSSTVIDDNSLTNYPKFSDTANSSDKAPFQSGQPIEYTPTVTLASSTTYWWRVRAIDPNGSNTYSAYSAPQSFTIDTTVVYTTWFQTTAAQFSKDTLFQTATTTNDSVTLLGANTTGSIYSPEIDYSDVTNGNVWGNISWHDNHATSTNILYHVEYLTSTSSWAIIPDSALAGNAAGTTVSPISIVGLDPVVYASIRVRGDYTLTTGTPTLYDWTLTWALGNAPPTLIKLFDNEKTGTTTPTFQFVSTNPFGNKLTYQIQWTTDATFASGLTTRTSSSSVGFSDIASSTATDPFISGDTIQYVIQSIDNLASSTTYWWRVRVQDPTGSASWSFWSTPQSFTTDTTVIQSTWFQTVNDQFNENILTRTGASGGDVTATSTTGNIAIYRSASGAEPITTTVFNNGWDTTVRQDKVFTLSGTTSISLQKGHYAVIYNAEFASPLAATNREEVQSDLNLAGTTLPAGWSQGIIKNTVGANEAFTAGGAIINVANTNDKLILQSFRTDTNPTMAMNRVGNTSGIELIKLDDAWSYIRLSRKTKQAGPVSTKSWIKVAYDKVDENSGSAFGFSSGGSGITLATPGHYLVFANTYGAITTNSETGVTQAIYLDKQLIPGSFTSVYMRGNANSDNDYQGAAAIGIIVQSTTTNQVLSVQLIRNIGTAAWTIDADKSGTYVNRTGLTVVKLPEADFIQLQESAHDNLNPSALTAINWNIENEKDTASFAHSTSSNPTRITANLAGDYLFLSALYAQPGAVANIEFNAGLRKGGAGTLNQYGQTGGFNSTAAGGFGNWMGAIFPSVVATNFFEVMTQATGTTLTAAPATTTGLAVEGLRIGSLSEADNNAKTMQSPDILFSSGNGPKWSTFSSSSTIPSGTSLYLQLLYFNSASGTYDLIPNTDLPGNCASTSTCLGFAATSSINISNLNHSTYNDIEALATFICVSGSCPVLHDWTVTWSQGINISGTAKAFDQTTNLTSGTVAVAVNGVLQAGKIATIGSGTWTIPNVTAFNGDVVTVFISSATGTARAIAITKYTTTNDITGMKLYQDHLTLGDTVDNPTITDADINQYDNGIGGTPIFDNVDSSNNLTVCSATPCTNARLLIMPGTIFQPASTGGVTVTTGNIQIDGTFRPDGNTIIVGNSWKDNATFLAGASTVIFNATSTNETIDSSVATTSASFFNVTFGQSGSTAKWNLISPLAASSTVAINNGTLSQGTSTISLGGNLTIGASGIFAKGTATTTFVGSGTNTWTDSSAGQDMGTVSISGSAETIQLGSNVKATNIAIGSGNTLDASTGNFGITVLGNWTNNNSFVARNGTVTFAATSTGMTINPGASSFYNITFNGAGGNWAFSTSSLTATNNFTITTGTVTLATGTTTVGGSFDGSGGTFLHNNGTLLLNSSGASTVHFGSSSLYNLTFNGSGSWSFVDTFATTTRNFAITSGAVTLPTGTLIVGGSFNNSGGSFSNNSGTVYFNSSSAQQVQLGGSSAYNMTFAGAGGTWTMLDTNATVANTITFQAGTTTLPAGILSVGGSFTNTGGAFASNGGTVAFISTGSGNTITPGLSTFSGLLFNSASGSWTLSGNATSTNNTTITAASSLTFATSTNLAVLGIFTNSVGGSPTNWNNSTLYLNSGTSYSLNLKTGTGDTYANLLVGASTSIKMWNSSAATTTVSATGSLYSQNHAGISGALNIWGAYTNAAAENWAAATDFDGTALGGSSRAVSVKIASSSVVTLSGTVNITGTSTATTTIANQGNGTYAMNITGGTLNAQYYQFSNLGTAGLSLSGTPTVTSPSLANGLFTLSASGTAMTIASTVIDQNPALQIFNVGFATSTGVSSGTNITENGTPTSTSYWWFRSSYGSIQGENFDNDPAPSGGNPGYIRWDNSGFNLTIAGHVYSGHGGPAMGNPPCDGTTNTLVTIVINGGASFSGSCAIGTGAYSIPNVSFVGDVTMTVYLKNASGGARAVTVTKTPTANISDLDLYQNSLIVRQEGVTPTSITDLAMFDSSKDASIPFSASTSTNTAVLSPNTELYVWTGKTFAPGGNITLQSGGSGDARDGRLYLATSSVFTAVGSQSFSIGGGLSVDSGATFTAASSTITFTATTTGKQIRSINPLTLNTVIINGVGGGWTLSNSAGIATTTVNSLALTSGTISGTGDMIVTTGGLSGSGTITMSGGTFQFNGTGTIGDGNPWQFGNLTFGNGTVAASSTNGATATTTISGILTVNTNDTLNAGSSPWVLSGSGTPFSILGTFNVNSAPFSYTSSAATAITTTSYANLTLAPSAAGSPTYTLLSGLSLNTNNLTIGDGSHPVTVTAVTNNPTITAAGSVVVASGSTFIAPNIGGLSVGGSWTNNGTFTSSSGLVTFNSTATGNSITPGSSSFNNLTLNSSSGGWTLTANATTTGAMSITAASNFTVATGTSLAVLGTFTNSVGGSATTFGGSVLFLNSGTSYSIDTKSVGGDTYGTLMIGPSTNIRMWNSSAATTTVSSSGSLYSMNHAGVNGALNIWGAYTRSSGSDYWDDATDFDGTSLGGSPRAVSVFVASSSSLSYSGGLLDIVGIATATTTIQNQGAGTFSFALSGGTLNASYYQIRNTDTNGLNLSGAPTISSLANGDYQLGVNGGAMMTVSASVINANPLAVFKFDRFATSTGISSGYNVMEVGTPVSSWKFNLGYGNFYGEAYNSDPGGDPGYILWDNSNALITVSGNVYADEGTTVDTGVCNGSAQNVRLVDQASTIYTASCNSSTGAYSIPGVSFNPGDVFTLYLASTTGKQAADVTVDPASNISGLNLYENRVIVRHENTTPITITKMAVYDSHNDANIPFTATTGGSPTLSLPPNTKLIVWTGKTFAPGGNVTIQSGGASSTSAYDGTMEVQTGAIFFASGTQTHTFGGNLIFDSGATLVSASSTFAFTATTTGHTITPSTASFYNITFNGIGGNWAFSAPATTTNNFTITTGTVTLPSGTLAVGGNFSNAGTFMHNNGTVTLISTATNTITASSSSFYNLVANGSGGAWSFVDTTATTSNNFTISAGTVTLPTNTLIVGGSFVNSGTFNTGVDTVRFTAAGSGQKVQGGSSNFYNLAFAGAGGTWSFLDTNATVSGNVTMTAGTTTLPSGTLTVGGSFVNSAVFVNATGTVTMSATSTGNSITPGSSSFNNLTLNSSSGGWTLTANATTTGAMSITAASNFTVATGTSLAVLGTFTNSVGGSATTFGGSVLFLNSGTSYSIDTKSVGGDTYGTLMIGPSTNIRMWNSSAATTTVSSSGSLYSMNHAGVNGALNIWGAYTRSSGSDYWDDATDFDGTSLGGSPRAVSVFVASSSSLSYSGGLLDIVGIATATTTIQNQGAGTFSFALSGGTLNASYYQIRNTDTNGLNLSGAPTISSLANGDYQLGVNGGAMIKIAATVVDANPSQTWSNDRFATSTGITSGYNVNLTSTSTNAWTFTRAYGNLAGEAYDNDGSDACGHIRWDDSVCLLLTEAHYQWRNDDGGEGALATSWYNASWSKREQIVVNNPNAQSYTNYPVRLPIAYASSMQSGFGDLRFTDSSGTTSIPYYVETVNPSASSTVWVQIPSLPASGSATIYMYYGNAGATTASNGSNTFSFYEDFETNTLSAYSGNSTDKSYFTTGTAFAHTGTYGLYGSTGNAGQKTANGGIFRTGSLLSSAGSGETIQYYQYVDSAQQDEPCTLFGVQAASQNYAVCLEEYPSATPHISLVKDVTYNDTSASRILATTSATYTTGWYQVVIDWLASHLINVNVYGPSGSLFGNLSFTDSSSPYSSGGMGFAFWAQHGGWDFYTARQYTASPVTYLFGTEQTNNGATFKAAQDTPLTGTNGAPIGSNLRLRFSIQNTGPSISGLQYRLQYAPLGAALNCESVSDIAYSDAKIASSCGSSKVCLASSSQFSNNAPTSPSLSFPATMQFSAGSMLEDPGDGSIDQTASSTLPNNGGTEVEYNFQFNSNATDNAYCLRVTKTLANDLDSYSHVAEAVVLHPPIIVGGVSLNSGQNIKLVEGTSTTILATSTVQDLNGYTDMISATTTIYRSSVAGGANCSANLANCYQIPTNQCTFSNCSGNQCLLSCSASIQYFADSAGGATSTYPSDTWKATMSVVDSTSLNGLATISGGVPLDPLLALQVTSPNINFGSLVNGANTGSTNATTTIINTGNSPIDVKVSGDPLNGSGGPSGSIPVNSQKYATSTFVYAGCALCQVLTGPSLPASVGVNITQATSTAGSQPSNIYFGLQVPTGINSGAYTGTNYFTAVLPGS